MKIGVTGTIGAGKSSFCRFLAQALADAGTPPTVIDADGVAREVIEASATEEQGRPGPLMRELVARFGAEILSPGGSLDRALLARRAFADDASASALNAIVHPVVRERIRGLSAGEGVFVLDVPLLFESGGASECDVTIAVIADEEIRRRRAVRFPDFEMRQARQWPQDRKADAADHVVENDGTLEDLRLKAVEIAKKLL